jgi:hypothetical protein
MLSTEPPAAQPSSNCTLRVGYVCANALAAESASTSAGNIVYGPAFLIVSPG